jgi:predicted 3-demethylubiquinone-9 3-methyltransferase (glyoxalase superfamily)
MSTCLWFDGKAEEAANHYVSVFPNSKITQIARRPPSSPGETGDVMTVAFELDGRPFLGLNGGPMFQFSEAVSVVVQCETQDEIDHYWDRLVEGGRESMCGWLKDRFGFSWQIVPSRIPEWMSGNPAMAERVANAFMKMRKLDITALEAAAKG